MAKIFPVYDFIKLYVKNNDVNIPEDEIGYNLTNLSTEHSEFIQLLIIHHNYLHGGYEAVPYNGKLLTVNSGVKYSTNEIPDELMNIIKGYMSLVVKLN